MKYKRYNEYGGFLNESNLIQCRVMEGETGQHRATQGKVGQSLGEGVQSGTMIDEAALGCDKEISVR